MVPPEGINFDENDEDLYYSKEEFEVADGEDDNTMNVQTSPNSGNNDGERTNMEYDENYWARK